MKTLLFLDACMRDPSLSRTSQLTQIFLNRWKVLNPDWTVETRSLSGADTPVLTADVAVRRDQAVAQGLLDSPLLAPARQFASADRVLIAAPTWDLSFPAALKVWLEWVSTTDVTFHCTREGEYQGLCKADKLLYITAMGGLPKGQTFGVDYLEGLTAMWGIPEFRSVSASFTDLAGDAGVKSLAKAQKELLELAEIW